MRNLILLFFALSGICIFFKLDRDVAHTTVGNAVTSKMSFEKHLKNINVVEDHARKGEALSLNQILPMQKSMISSSNAIEVQKALDAIKPLDRDRINEQSLTNPHAVSKEVVSTAKTMARLMDLVEQKQLSTAEVAPIVKFFVNCSSAESEFSREESGLQITCLTNLKEIVDKYQIYEKDLREVLARTSPRNIQIYEFLREHQSRGT